MYIIRNKTMSGKGDKQRPTDKDKYEESYERIWGKPKIEASEDE